MMMDRPFAVIAISAMMMVLVPGCIELEESEDDGWWTVDLDTGDGFVEVHCEPALTDEEHRTGLMGRDSLGEYDGMVFVFDPPRNVTIWMKDTKLALDVIFIDRLGEVILIIELGPGWGMPDEQVPYCRSPGPVSYVIEVNLGFCRTHGVVEGALATVHERR